MVIVGIDAHKRSHTAVAVDASGRSLGQRTIGTTSEDHLALLGWAEQFGPQRSWAIEDCRHLSRRLEADLLAAGESIVRVPTKLMAHAPDAARSYGKSDPIDALAVARAALREPDLPTAQLDGPARDVRLLSDHRDHLIAERTRVINRLRWHLHELDPGHEPPARTLWRPKHLTAIAARLAEFDSVVARLARTEIEDCRRLTHQIQALDEELQTTVKQLAPTLLDICGCATLTAAKIIGETADVRRFRSRHAFARHNGTAPLPVWSSNKPRHRLSRTGNRQLNAAIHRRHHPSPLPRTRSSAARSPPRGRQQQGRITSRPQAPTIRRRLSSPAIGRRARRKPCSSRRVVDIGASGRNSTGR